MEPTSEAWAEDTSDPAADPAPGNGQRGCGGFMVGLVLSVTLGAGFGLVVSYLLRKLGV